MSQAGYTPISLYYSTTAAAAPSSGNLVAGELALNTLDEKLYFKNSAGTVKLLASSAASSATVSSVAMSVPAFLSIAGSPITTTGTLAVTYSGTALPVANGGTGQTSYTDGQLLIGNTTGNTLTKATLTAGTGISITNGSGTITIAATGAPGTVTSVAQSFTGGIISVGGSPITSSGTLALTVAGTSGGIPYFSSGTAWASSAALTQYGVVYGGGAGAAPVATAAGTTGQVLTANTGAAPTWGTAATGTVTSVGWTGGIVSVATATTTPAFTIAGTSGGIPYFSSGTTWATSAALAANAIVLGGGAGTAPATTTTGTGVVTAIGSSVNNTNGLVTQTATLAASAILIGGGASTGIASTTTGTGVVTALGNNTNTASGFPTGSGTATLTNKRIDPRTSSTASTATLTPDISSFDQYSLTAQAVGLTVAAPTGTPVDGNKLIIRILDNGTAQTISWNATYTVIGVTLPTSTTVSKMVYVGCIYNSTNTRWDVVAVTTQA
jgi:hypothetical protein